MFDKFGKMDYDGLLRTAAAEKEEGDLESLLALAQENGIEKEDAEDYFNGDTDTFASPLQAATGKLAVESEELGLKGILSDWTELIVGECLGDVPMCVAIRQPEKSLAECLSELLAYSFENKVQVPDAVVDITEVTAHGRKEKMRTPLYLGFPSRKEARKLIHGYYAGGDAQ